MITRSKLRGAPYNIRAIMRYKTFFLLTIQGQFEPQICLTVAVYDNFTHFTPFYCNRPVLKQKTSGKPRSPQ